MSGVGSRSRRSNRIATRIVRSSKAILFFLSLSFLAKFFLTALAIKGVLSALASIPVLLFQGGVSGGFGLLLSMLYKETEQMTFLISGYIDKAQVFMKRGQSISIVGYAIAISSASVFIMKKLGGVLGFKTNGSSQVEELAKQTIEKSPLRQYLKAEEAEAKRKLLQIQDCHKELNPAPPISIPPEISVLTGGVTIRCLWLGEKFPEACKNQGAVTTAVAGGRLFGNLAPRIGVFNVVPTALIAMGIQLYRNPDLGLIKEPRVAAQKMLPSVVNAVTTQISMSFVSKLLKSVFQPNVASVLIGVTSAGIGIICEMKTMELLNEGGIDRRIEDNNGRERGSEGLELIDEEIGTNFDEAHGIEALGPSSKKRAAFTKISTAVLPFGARAMAFYFLDKVISDREPSLAPAAPVITACVIYFAPMTFNFSRDMMKMVSESLSEIFVTANNNDTVIEEAVNKSSRGLSENGPSVLANSLFMITAFAGQNTKRRNTPEFTTFTSSFNPLNRLGVPDWEVLTRPEFTTFTSSNQHRLGVPDWEVPNRQVPFKRPFTPSFNQSRAGVPNSLPFPSRIGRVAHQAGALVRLLKTDGTKNIARPW